MNREEITTELHKFLATHHENVECDTCINVFEDLRSLIEEIEAGRQSVIENASKLNWEDAGMYGQYGTYLNVCRAHKPLGDFLIRRWFQPKDIELFFLDEPIRGGFKSVEEAKKYAKEIYENEIKKVLEL